MVEGGIDRPTSCDDPDVTGLLVRLVKRAAAGTKTGDRQDVVRLLYQLLSPVVCRRLGVYVWPEGFLLSIIVPAYNEAATIRQVVERIDGVGVPYEIIAVDDASTDGTGQILDELVGRFPLRVIHHQQNQGKGAAIRRGFGQLRGQVVIIQDADLEYDPSDYPMLLGPIIEDRADVVFGSRFSSINRPVSRYWHQTANRLVTLLSNMFTNLKLTDVETGYKVMRRELAEQLGPRLRENGFGIELEITARLARIKGVRFYELPISYSPRGYAEGKKIGWRDAVRALWCVVRYRLVP
jgi:glycosyltransferase involved in cell wall biosynthesis